MTDRRDIFVALEGLALRVARTAPVPFIDPALLALLDLAVRDEANRPVLMRAILALAEARERLSAARASPALRTSTPEPDAELASPYPPDAERRARLRALALLRSPGPLVVGLGYGAILTLCATGAAASGKTPKAETLLLGALILASLILYVGFHGAALVWINLWRRRGVALVKCLAKGHDWRLSRSRPGYSTCWRCGARRRLALD
ncbi:MAG: hypothetical protein ACREEW_00090 [Caulobacteraceae bacterium]